jgi:hypothetical protein
VKALRLYALTWFKNRTVEKEMKGEIWIKSVQRPTTTEQIKEYVEFAEQTYKEEMAEHLPFNYKKKSIGIGWTRVHKFARFYQNS